MKIITLIIPIFLLLWETLSLSLTTKTHSHTRTGNNIGFKGSFYMDKSKLKNRKRDTETIKFNVPVNKNNEVNPYYKGYTAYNLDERKTNNQDKHQSWSGWVSYIKYRNDERPKGFFKNPSYFTQKKKENLKDNNINPYIVDKKENFAPNNKSFYGQLNGASMIFLHDKNNVYQSNDDVLHLQDMIDVYEDVLSAGGVIDLGNFSEGFCFKIVTVNGDEKKDHTSSANTPSKQLYWIICSPEENTKNILMKSIHANRLLIQKKLGYSVTTKPTSNVGLFNNNELDSNKLNQLTNQGSNSNQITSFTTGKVNGEWYTVQDWTPCSLKCGGGYTYLQRLCIPPKNGGNPCIGDPLIRKSCNIQPCEKENPKPKPLDFPTTYQKRYVQVEFMNRPQRYDKCVIKESDMMMYNSTTGFESETKLSYSSKIFPVRVVMNTRTITTYLSELEDSRVMSIDIQKAKFYQSERDEKCFILKESYHKALELCPFKQENIIDEWNYDFNLFKNQCSENRDLKDLDDHLKKDLENKIENAKMNAFKEEEDKLKQKIKKEEIEQLYTNGQKMKLQSKIALAREINLEERIKLEEEEKVNREKEELQKQIEKEEQKGKALLEAITRKQIENQMNIQVQNEVDEMSKVKETTNEEIMNQRLKLKMSIKQIHERGNLEKEMLKNQLVIVKNQYQSSLADSNKRGSANTCAEGKKSKEQQEIYCLAKHSNNSDLLIQCKSDFCNVCCETEFGINYLDEREICYKQVCSEVNDLNNNANTLNPYGVNKS